MNNFQVERDPKLFYMAVCAAILQGLTLIPIILFLLIASAIFLPGLIELAHLQHIAAVGLILTVTMAVLTALSIVLSWSRRLHDRLHLKTGVDGVMLIVNLFFLLLLRFTELEKVFWVTSGSFIALLNLWSIMTSTISACILLIAISICWRAISTGKFPQAIWTSLSSLALAVILLVIMASTDWGKPDFRNKEHQRYSVRGVIRK